MSETLDVLASLVEALEEAGMADLGTSGYFPKLEEALNRARQLLNDRT